jgi:hypothetical protein
MLRTNKHYKTAKPFQTKIHIWSVVRQEHMKYRCFLQLLLTCVWWRNHYWAHTGPISYTNYGTRVGMSQDQFLAILTMSHPNETHIPRHQKDYVPLYEVNSNMNQLLSFWKLCIGPLSILKQRLWDWTPSSGKILLSREDGKCKKIQ